MTSSDADAPAGTGGSRRSGGTEAAETRTCGSIRQGLLSGATGAPRGAPAGPVLDAAASAASYGR